MFSTKQLSSVQARTRAAILAATASALAANRTATMPEIATVAGVGRTTLHRYFADRETLIYEATLDSIRVLTEAVDEAAIDDGPAVDAMRRFITARSQSVNDWCSCSATQRAPRYRTADQPNEELMMRPDRTRTTRRGSSTGPQPDMDPALALRIDPARLRGSGQRRVPRHTVAPLIIRTFERGICPHLNSARE